MSFDLLIGVLIYYPRFLIRVLWFQFISSNRYSIMGSYDYSLGFRVTSTLSRVEWPPMRRTASWTSADQVANGLKLIVASWSWSRRVLIHMIWVKLWMCVKEFNPMTQLTPIQTIAKIANLIQYNINETILSSSTKMIMSFEINWGIYY